MSAPQDPITAEFFARNASWARAVERADPGFFERSAQGQSPKVFQHPIILSILWIGCADSRVPPSVVTASMPGEIFVHRNIANQFPTEDDNAHSVLDYAVHHLGVQHVVIVGHTHCGGVQAALAAAQSPKPPTDAIERWLTPLAAVAVAEHLHDDEEGRARLTEANVRLQMKNVREAVAEGTQRRAGGSESSGEVWVHGWVYELEKGLLRVVETTEEVEGVCA
ncbi:carbonic anhydrase 1 [Amylostereum chailletii]|nr:carbonic anhydrase 1 [Amylostereum chailletii]